LFQLRLRAGQIRRQVIHDLGLLRLRRVQVVQPHVRVRQQRQAGAEREQDGIPPAVTPRAD